LHHPYETRHIPLKNLKQLKYTFATCAFNATSPCCSAEWGLVGVWCSPEAATQHACRRWLAVVAARRGREASAARAARWPRPRDLERAAACRAPGRAGSPSAATWRRLHTMPGKASGQAGCLRGLAAVRSEVAGER
jgi:hypothetical protein